MLNRVVLIGRLTRDPEMKYTPQGVAVTQMGIAVQRFTKNETGDYDVDFFNVVAWRRTAEFAANYLTKGRLISVDGRLQTRSWVAQDGSKRSVVEIVADNIDTLERRPDGEGAPEGEAHEAAPERTPVAAAAGGKRASAPAPPPDDDLDESDPFADE
ncbi:MAG TPA: single-stranded DNA-binding protein [Chthonomonadaceae bacterium]|nr:single-stranded DNA-binding protein [Chthonomonadaceae bacterium]